MRHLLLALLLILPACTTPVAQPATMPTYAELAGRHNDRVKDIKQFWARSVIEVRWVDAKGGRRFEQGDGHLILSLPKHSALTIGKLGQTKLWAGSNDTHYWLFDELDGKKLYLGRHDGKTDPGVTGAAQRSPLPVRPVDLPRLLAILPIDPNPTPAGAVQWIDGAYMIAPPGERTRYYFHPLYSRVVRVELLDAQGRVTLTAKLDKPERIIDEYDRGGPFLNTFIEAAAPGQEGNMTMYLSDMTDAESKVNPKVFDLDVLMRTLKPEAVVPVDSQ